MRLVLLCFLLLASFAQAEIVLKDDQPVAIWPAAEILIEASEIQFPTGQRTANPLDNFDWQSTSGFSSNFGASYGKIRSIWLKVPITNTSQFEQFVIANQYTLLEVLNVYAEDEQGIWQQYRGGAELTNSERALPWSQPNVVLNLQQNQQHWLYIEIQNKTSTIVNLSIGRESAIAHKSSEFHQISVMFYSVMLAFMLYSLILALRSNEKAFWYYVAYQLGVVIYSANIDGLDRLLLPNLFQYDLTLIAAVVGLTAMFIGPVLFLRYFIHLTHTKWLNRFTFAYVAMVVLAAPFGILRIDAIYGPFVLLMVLGIFIYILWVLVFAFKQKSRWGVALCLAWLSNISLVLLFYLYIEGALPDSWWFYHAVHIGSVLEAIVLSLALAERFRSIQQDMIRQQLDALDAEQQTNALKQSFLQIVSHELRTPLNGINGAMELLALSASDEQRDYIAMANQSSVRLNKLVSEILLFTEISSGRKTVQRQVIELIDFHQQLLEKAQSMHQLDIKLIKTSQILPASLNIDSNTVHELLIQILHNGIRFSDQQAVELEYQIDGGEFIVSVQDKGPGISDEQIKQIMSAFYQLEQGLNRHHEGLGLGLTVVNAIIEWLGGSLEFRSSDQGTQVVVRIPCE